MDWIEEQLSRAPTPNTIVHLGAGLCRELPHYIRSRARRIILFEPNPELLPALERQTEGHSNVDVFPVAVAAESGRQTLKIYNYPDLSSLRSPTGLVELLPGLQQTGQVIVDVIAAHTLPEQLGLENDDINWLVIDTPGEEGATIEDLAQHEQLTQFDRIIIRAGAESLYDETPGAKQLTGQLEKLGYYIEGAEDRSDPDWPRYNLRLNPKAIEVQRLKREVEALTEQQAQLDAAKQQSEQQRKVLSVQNQNLQARLDELDQSRQQAEQQADKHKAESSELRSRLEKLAQQLEEVQQQAEEHRAQLEKAQDDLSLALRLQMLRENDLKELQTRYGEVLNTKEEQQDLLTQLHHRLSRAAEYLQLVHTQSDDQRLPDELLEALTGKGEERD